MYIIIVNNQFEINHAIHSISFNIGPGQGGLCISSSFHVNSVRVPTIGSCKMNCMKFDTWMCSELGQDLLQLLKTFFICLIWFFWDIIKTYIFPSRVILLFYQSPP